MSENKDDLTNKSVDNWCKLKEKKTRWRIDTLDSIYEQQQQQQQKKRSEWTFEFKWPFYEFFVFSLFWLSMMRNWTSQSN